jgi:hypothetical protein
MAFRYVHIRPNLSLAIRAVEGVRSTPIRPPPVTSFGAASSSRRPCAGHEALLWSRVSVVLLKALSANRLNWLSELPSDPLFLLGLTSCGWRWRPARVRPAGAPLGCGRRRAGPRRLRAARSKREAGSQFVSWLKVPRGCTGGPGVPGGQKKALQIGHGCN